MLLGLIRIWNVHIATIIRVETLQGGKPTIETAETPISIASGNRKEKIMNSPDKSPINLCDKFHPGFDSARNAVTRFLTFER
jgi:hypothetical protein